MKSQESKTAAAKPAAAKKPQAAPTAKPSKKIAGLPHDDVELLAMSDSDYMNPAQLAYFKAKLISMRDEILENARETGEHLKENEVFADPNDRATVEEENLLEQRVRDRERKLLKKINASIIRIDEGEYGYCLETGEPIGLPRLLARPTAELSIEAQEKHERMEKLYAD
ncbi:MAG: RNA polymerase-binding protein DksA [Hydrogenophilales bacterium 28-61-23]|nr:MAG: RNA polymerase-binding protein DksA [Hydrogenophilales bacterium 28-61-23]